MHGNTHYIAEQVQAEQGWTDAALLEIVLDYIDNQGGDEAFRDYLTERAWQEWRDQP